MNQQDPYLTAKEICEERKIAQNTFYRYVRDGLMPKGEPAGIRARRWRKSVVDAAFSRMSEGRAA